MNLKLAYVVSDITGVTGMGIIKAILGGERDPVKLAELRDPRCKSSEATVARASRGTTETVYEERYRDRLLRNLKRRAAELGFELTAISSSTGQPALT